MAVLRSERVVWATAARLKCGVRHSCQAVTILAVNTLQPSRASLPLSHDALLTLKQADIGYRQPPVLTGVTLDIYAGLNAVSGDEGTGKSALIRSIAGDLSLLSGDREGPVGVWLDLRLPQYDESTPLQVWKAMSQKLAQWSEATQTVIATALELDEHLDKRLFMLSTGTRRKVGWVTLIASGAPITCIDQPYAGLDRPSVDVLRRFLNQEAAHPSRAWVIADYEADPALAWQQIVTL